MAELGDFESRAEAAMLAAAVGDALGWPQEDRAGRVGGGRGVKPQLDFIGWRRRDGGRYASHEEAIRAGEYSDDTQLIAASGRSLLAGARWWERLTRLELPFWLLYERGGGGATKRAAQAWTKGARPWVGASRDRYFAAGGNGVAMRVLPHCVVPGDDFGAVARLIVADGIATHGHPRALVGALAYAYALWRALRRRDRLSYGALIEETRSEVASWSRRPSVDNFAPDWQSAANETGDDPYDELWESTVLEMQDLLGVCAEAIAEGALSVDEETLKRLGAFDKRISSAGTVTAAGAIFLASRYASRPTQGLLAAAFAPRADTDTLASMTGSLLAAISGGDWLGKMRERVQDDRYLIRLVRALAGGSPQEEYVPVRPDLRAFVQGLVEAPIGKELVLPDGRVGRLRNVADHPTKTRNDIKTFIVETEDGQTLFFKRIRRLQQEREPTSPQGQRRRPQIGLALQVDDIERSLGFWRDIAGLDVTVTEHYVNVGGYIALMQAKALDSTRNQPRLQFEADDDLHRPKRRIIVFVEARSELEDIRQRLERAAVHSVLVPGGDAEWRGVRCIDPEGNVVEFRERNGLA